MRVLIGCRCAIDHVRVKEHEALEIGTPSVIAVDGSRRLACDKFHDELVQAMKLMADCSPGVYENRTLMFKTAPADEWTTLTGDALKRGIENIASRIAGTNDGRMYITVPSCVQVEIYKIEEV